MPEQEIQKNFFSKLDSNFSNLFKASCNGISIVEWSVALSELWTSFSVAIKSLNGTGIGSNRVAQISINSQSSKLPILYQPFADVDQQMRKDQLDCVSALTPYLTLSYILIHTETHQIFTNGNICPPHYRATLNWNYTCLNWNSTCFASKRMMVIVLEILMMTSGRINIWSSAIHIVLMIQQVWRGSKVWAHSQLHHHKQVKSLALQSELRRKWDRFYTLTLKGAHIKVRSPNFNLEGSSNWLKVGT